MNWRHDRNEGGRAGEPDTGVNNLLQLLNVAGMKRTGMPTCRLNTEQCDLSSNILLGRRQATREQYFGTETDENLTRILNMEQVLAKYLTHKI